MPTAIEDIAAERQRQMEVEGWTRDHDDSHVGGEMAIAAACYASDKRVYNTASPANWPWSESWWKPTNRRRDLVKAGALIVAEIERLDRMETKPARAIVDHNLRHMQALVDGGETPNADK